MSWRSRRRGGYGDYGGWGGFRPYVSVGERQADAAKQAAKLAKKGRVLSPVQVAGRKLATTFWGQAWNDNLESHSDYSNRLPRGSRYVRNGLVIDLQIEPGKISSLVQGSDLYEAKIEIAAAPRLAWKELVGECSGQIGSVVELLSGKLSKSVMQVLSRPKNGLLPTPGEIKMSCSCPDWASMCKHLAATLYGVGSRLDTQPELLFKLRHVDANELLTAAGAALAQGRPAAQLEVLDDADLGSVFGIELEDRPSRATPKSAPRGGKPSNHNRLPASAKARSVSPALQRGPAEKPRAKRKPAVALRDTPRKRSTTGSRVRPAAAPAAAVPAPRGKARATTTSVSADKTRPRKAAPAGCKAVLDRILGEGRVFHPVTLSAQELIKAGVPRTTFQNWLASGTLATTGERGLYLSTPRTRAAIERVLAK